MSNKKIIWYRVVFFGLIATVILSAGVVLLKLAVRYTSFLWNLL